MGGQIRFTIYTIISILLLTGCVYQRKVVLPPAGLPEEIFSIPQSNNISDARVGVFLFSEPTYAPGKVRTAAQLLCQELEQKGVFSSVLILPDFLDIALPEMIDVARMKRCDLIITGELFYYFDGSDLAPSRVGEEIRVIKVRRGKQLTLWHAKATKIAAPAFSTDYIIVHGKGAPASSTTVLMKSTAEEFCNMLITCPPMVVQP